MSTTQYAAADVLRQHCKVDRMKCRSCCSDKHAGSPFFCSTCLRRGLVGSLLIGAFDLVVDGPGSFVVHVRLEEVRQYSEGIQREWVLELFLTSIW
jgi:hypothetical protein